MAVKQSRDHKSTQLSAILRMEDMEDVAACLQFRAGGFCDEVVLEISTDGKVATTRDVTTTSNDSNGNQ